MVKNLIASIFIVAFSSCEEIIEVPNISEDRVSILAPQNNTELEAGTINFSWNPVKDASAYSLQIAEPNFNNATQILVDSTVSITSFSKIMVSGNYEWRVQAQNEEYSTNFSTITFTVID